MRGTSGWTNRTSIFSLILRQTFPLQVAILVLGLALPVLALFPLRLQEKLIDEVIPKGEADLIATIALQYLAVILIVGLLKFLVTFLRGWIQEIVSRTLRVAVIEAQRHRNVESATRKLGTINSVIANEVEDLGAFAAEALNTPLIEGGTLLSLLGFVAWSDLRLAAIGVGALVLQALLTPMVQHRINRLTRKRITALRRAGLDMIDAADPAQHAMNVPALHEVRRTYRLRLRMNVLKAALKVVNNLVMSFATIALLCYGGLLVIRGEIGVGLVVAFLSGLNQIADHWGELLDFYRRYTDAKVKYRLVAATLVIDG